MHIAFADLLRSYPTAPKPELFKGMGGEWPSLVNNPNYANTCAIRLSLALKQVGFKVPDKYKEAVTGNGTPIVLKVATMGKLVSESFGRSYWGMSKEPGKPIDAATVPRKTGILVYHVKWNNATGHFDLWTGTRFAGAGAFADIKDGYSLELWHLP